MGQKIKATKYDPQPCPSCGQRLKTGKEAGLPIFRWVCLICNKAFCISEGGIGDEIEDLGPINEGT